MPQIIVQGNVIEIPESGESPNWAPAIIQAFVAISDALQGIVGNFDVSPQSFVIDSYNPGTNISIPDLSFPTSDVRAAFVRYTVHRTTDTPAEADETGMLWIVYNDNNGSWDISREKSGDAFITFDITNAGQVRFSTTAIAGSNHEGFITYTAQALQNP